MRFSLPVLFLLFVTSLQATKVYIGPTPVEKESIAYRHLAPLFRDKKFLEGIRCAGQHAAEYAGLIIEDDQLPAEEVPTWEAYRDFATRDVDPAQKDAHLKACREMVRKVWEGQHRQKEREKNERIEAFLGGLTSFFVNCGKWIEKEDLTVKLPSLDCAQYHNFFTLVAFTPRIDQEIDALLLVSQFWSQQWRIYAGEHLERIAPFKPIAPEDVQIVHSEKVESLMGKLAPLVPDELLQMRFDQERYTQKVLNNTKGVQKAVAAMCDAFNDVTAQLSFSPHALAKAKDIMEGAVFPLIEVMHKLQRDTILYKSFLADKRANFVFNPLDPGVQTSLERCGYRGADLGSFDWMEELYEAQIQAAEAAAAAQAEAAPVAEAVEEGQENPAPVANAQEGVQEDAQEEA